jgi:hypothetical protein
MMMTHAQPSPRKRIRCAQRSSDLDEARLGTTVRELAIRAYRIVRGTDGSASAANDSDREMVETCGQIVRLERNLSSRQLDGLTISNYALTERAEECLADSVETGGTVGLLPRNWASGDGSL